VVETSKLKEGVINNVEFDGNITNYIKNSIVDRIKKSDTRYVFESYHTKNDYQLDDIDNLVTFVSNIISKSEKCKLKKREINEIKSEIIQFVSHNTRLNESNETDIQISESVTADLFYTYVAREILNRGETQVKLEEMEIPRSVKLLVKPLFKQYLTEYNNTEISQLNETIADSTQKLIAKMTREDFIRVIADAFSMVNEFYTELDYDIESAKQLLQSAISQSSLKPSNTEIKVPLKGKSFGGIKKYNVENILYDLIAKTPKVEFTEENLILKLIVQSPNKNSQMLQLMVKKYKNKYNDLILAILSQFRAFITQYGIKDKIAKWYTDDKISQSFLTVITAFFDDRSNFMTNISVILDTLYWQTPLLSHKELLEDCIEWLDTNSDDATHWYTKLSHKDYVKIEKYGLRPLSVASIESFIIDCTKILLPYLKQINQQNSITVKNVVSSGADQVYYFIPFEIVSKILPSPIEQIGAIKEIMNMSDDILPKFYQRYRLSAYENLSKSNRKIQTPSSTTKSDNTVKQGSTTQQNTIKQGSTENTVKQGVKVPNNTQQSKPNPSNTEVTIKGK
jgi:hypothetical protein